MRFRIAKINPQVLDDIANWKAQQLQLLDDYLNSLSVDNIPESGRVNPSQYKKDVKQGYIRDIDSAERRYQQGLKAKERAKQLTPEQIASLNATSASASEYLDPQVPSQIPTQVPRTAKVPQDSQQIQQGPRGFNPETLLPEGIELNTAIAIAKQDAARKFPNNPQQQTKEFYKGMQRQGLGYDTERKQWVAATLLGGWTNGQGGRKSRTVDQRKLEAMTGVKINPLIRVGSDNLEDAQRLWIDADIPANLDDELDINWWNKSTIRPRLEEEIDKALVGANTNIDYYYDTRINTGLAKYLEQRGFQQIPETEGYRWTYRNPREQAEVAWSLAGQFSPKIVNGRAIPWDKEEWIKNYLAKNSPTPIAANAAQVVETAQNNFSLPRNAVRHYPNTANSTAFPSSEAEMEAILNDVENHIGASPVNQVLSSQPGVQQIRNNSGVNQAVDGTRVFSSTGLPGNGGSGNPPGKPPGGGSYNPGDGSSNVPDSNGNTGNWWGNVWDGVKRGFNYSANASDIPGRTVSVIWNRAPKEQYENLTPEGKAAFFGARVLGEMGNGTRQVLWTAHPADFTSTHSVKVIKNADGNRVAQVLIPYATATALELGSQTYNPFNLGQGGRVAGYQAINPDEDDPRYSTTPFSELVVDRGFFGRRGKLLPWEQFREERPDISYEQYAKYQDYLKNKDDNLLRDITGGLVKGTMDGINGPELAVMGYSVTPVGALSAAGTLLIGRHLVGRTAALRI